MASSSAFFRASGPPAPAPAVPFTGDPGDRWDVRWKLGTAATETRELMELMEVMEVMGEAMAVAALGCAQVAQITKIQQAIQAIQDIQDIQVHLLHLPEHVNNISLGQKSFRDIDHLNTDEPAVLYFCRQRCLNMLALVLSTILNRI